MNNYLLPILKITTSIVLTMFVESGSNSLKAEDDSFTQTRLDFFNTCNNGPISISSENKAILKFEITGLQPGAYLKYQLYLGAVGKNLWSRNDDGIEIGDSGRFQYKKKIKLDKKRILKDVEGPGIYRASLHWSLEDNSASGATVKDIFIVNDNEERFFKVESNPICKWQTDIYISSEYHFNEGTGSKRLSRQEALYDLSGVNLQPGISIGNGSSNNSGVLSTLRSSSPLTSQIFFFSHYHNYIKTNASYLIISQAWELLPGQGGYYGERDTFIRYKAQAYKRHKKFLKCEQWKTRKIGYLDVATTTTDFFVVPKSMSNDLEKSVEFMENAIPSINTCNVTDRDILYNYTVQSSNAKLIFTNIEEN